MTATVAFRPVYGGQRQVDNILKNVPHWWDTREGSRFFALLSAFGRSDWEIGGDTVPLVVYPPSSASASGVGSSGSFVDSSAEWEPDTLIDMYLQDKDRTRFLIKNNSTTVLTLEEGAAPVSGPYKIVRTGSALQEVKYDGFLRTAVGGDLETVGRNVGVYRPASDMTDDVFRKLIPLLSWEPKQARVCIEKILTVLFGEKRDLRNNPSWDCFELRNNEIVVEVPQPALPAGRASYLYATATPAVDGTNPLTSYVAQDAAQDGPAGRMGLVLAGPVSTGDGGTIDADTLKRILYTYARAAGVRVTVEFF